MNEDGTKPAGLRVEGRGRIWRYLSVFEAERERDREREREREIEEGRKLEGL